VIQICKAFGAAQIIAIDVAEDKLQQMKQLGATHTINAQTTSDVHSAILALTDQQGVDVAIEALGRPATFQQATQAVAKGGRAVAIGLASPGVFGQIEMNNLVRRGVRVIGSYGGRVRQDMPVVVDLVERGVVDVKKGISKRYQGLEKAQQAYEDLQNGKITGRCIVEMM
jgi:threonine dehydrogenase-like Zn-dependent dehydrogenase